MTFTNNFILYPIDTLTKESITMYEQPVLNAEQITTILSGLTTEVRSLASEVQRILNELHQAPTASPSTQALEPDRYGATKGGESAGRDSKTARFLNTVHRFPGQWVLWGTFTKEEVAKATLYKRRSVHTDLLFRIVKVVASGTPDSPGAIRWELLGMLPEEVKGEEE